MNTLHSFALDLARSRSERDAAQAACERLAGLLAASSCQVLLRTERGGLRVAGGHPPGRQPPPEPGGVVERALEAELPAMEAVPGGGELVALPLIGAPRPLGVVLCECRRRLDVEAFELAEQAADLCAVSFAAHHSAAEAEEHAQEAQALLELSSALGLQPTRQGTAELLCLAVARLVPCDAVAVWLRDGDTLTPAASWGYAGDARRALERFRLPADAAVVAEAVLSRRIAEATLLDLPEVPLGPAGAPRQSRLVLVGIGERAANRALVSLVRPPLAGPLPDHEQRILTGVQDQALLAFENRLLAERLERAERATARPRRRTASRPP